MKKRRILLMYITKVSGHRQATVAIQQSIRQLDPTAEIPCVNGFGYTYPILEKVVNRAYMGVIKRTPKVWDYLYDNPKVVKQSESIKNFLHKTSHTKLEKLLNRYRPDTIVCTQAFPCGMVADYKKEHNLDFRLIGVLTDFQPHSYWINEGVDHYIVPCQDAKDRLITMGLDESVVDVYGVPIKSKFTNILNRDEIAAQMGLDTNIPIILIMGGGQGLGPIKKVVRSLLKREVRMQLIVIAGTNKKLIKWLHKKNSNHAFRKYTDKKVYIIEYAMNVDELMEVSDLIITKPGGMTTSEALTKGLPMVIIDPIPGQEMRNSDFLMKNGIAIRVDNEIEVGEEVELLLKSPNHLASMSEAAYANSKPYASQRIAELILQEQKVPVLV